MANNTDEYMLSGRHMWRSVILQAMEEAEGRCLALGSSESAAVDIQAARDWLMDGDGLRDVWRLCEFGNDTLGKFILVQKGKYANTAD